jgi:uncharacterized protein (TIGR01777 family)
MKVLLTGATGLIGRELTSKLTDVVVLSRDPDRARQQLHGVETRSWFPETEPPAASVFEDVEVVFNLAGEPVADGRWTSERKRRIHDSRIIGTRNLIAGLARLDKRPRVLVSASAVGYYGDRGDEVLDETSTSGRGFLADVCVEWEREARAAERLGIRVVCVRTGIVLARGGGALSKMLTPFQLGAGGRLGDGRQWMPWIHLDDEVGILLHAMNDNRVQGIINAVGPEPVTNAEFTKELSRIVQRPAFFSAPKLALRLAFGELSEVLTSSQRVLPKVAERTGYDFKHPEFAEAITAAIST